MEDKRIGTAEVGQEGLYWCADVRCELPEGIYRICAQNVQGAASLGVLMPQDGRMCLQKRLSRRSFCFYPDTVLTVSDTPGWQPAARVDGWELPGAVQRGGEVLAPYEKDAPFLCMPLFCFFRLVTRQEKPYWQLLVDENGSPKMP